MFCAEVSTVRDLVPATRATDREQSHLAGGDETAEGEARYRHPGRDNRGSRRGTEATQSAQLCHQASQWHLT